MEQASLGNIKVTDLDFIDDVAIQSESLESLLAALNAFSNEAKLLGPEVSWTKTKTQDFGGLLGEPVRYILAVSTSKSQRVLHALAMQSMSQGHQTRKSIDGLVWQQEP